MKKKAILSNGLHVDEKYVTSKMLKAFTHTFVNYEGGGPDKVPDNYDGSLDFEAPLYEFLPAKHKYVFFSGVRKLLKEQFKQFRIIDRRSTVPMRNSSLKYLNYKKSFSLKEMQKGIVKKWLSKGYGLIRAPARSGKTIIMGSLVVELKQKTLILADQIELLQQWEKEFRSKVSNVDRLEEKTGRPIIGMLKDWSDIDKYDIILSSWQKWNKNQTKIKKYKDSFGLILVDEVHKCNANCPKNVISGFTAKYKGGVTATVERKDGREIYMRYIIGPVVAEANPEQMKCKVCPVRTNIHPPSNSNWAYFITNYCKNKDRNKIIVDLTIDQVKKGKHVLIGSDRKDHVKALALMLRLNGIAAEPFYSGCPDRKGVLERAKTGKTKVVVALRSMLTGINIPLWDTFLNILPINNPPTFYQQYSRIRTIIPEKKEAILFDFIDNSGSSWGSFNKRKIEYDKQGFSYIPGLDFNGKGEKEEHNEKKVRTTWDSVKSSREKAKPFFVRPKSDGRKIADLFG